MAMCKCRDTGSKRCKWEHVSDDIGFLLNPEPRLDRKRTNELLRNGTHDEFTLELLTPAEEAERRRQEEDERKWAQEWEDAYWRSVENELLNDYYTMEFDDIGY